MRVAIFGGTFDPIHSGHLAIARQAADRFHLDRVLFVPAARPPHKGGATYAAYEHRIRMAQLACQTDPRFEASRLEEGTERSYSIDTIEKVRAHHLAAGGDLFFLIGADAFAEIATWRRWRDVVRSVRFIVVSRAGIRYAVPEGAAIERLDSLAIPISSSEIRRKLALGQRPTEVPEAVLRYIAEHHLYQKPEARSWTPEARNS
jgi:nicotinate-nucleotide adenylyltransferase